MQKTRCATMPRLVHAAARVLCAFGATLAFSGCLTRVLEIRSDPPGAQVFVNGQPVGTTPVVYKFSHYGDRSLILTMDERATVNKTCTLEAPWWGCFPCDLFAELWPGPIVDRHQVAYTMEKAASVDADLETMFKNQGTMERAMHSEEQ